MIVKQTVFLKKCTAYDLQIIRGIIDEVCPLLIGDNCLRGARVLLKPNLISSRGGFLACTNSAFVEAVASWFVDNGAKVRIGDSPAFGSAAATMQALGMDSFIKKMGLEVVEFTEVRKIKLDSAHIGSCILPIASEALECDMLVNLPRIKAHDQMGVTMAVKNFFGVVKGLRKPLLHMSHGHKHKSFASLLLGIQDLFPAHITLVDGIEVMNRRGPLAGDKLDLHCIAGSDNSVAIDRALLACLEILPQHCPVSLEAQRQNIYGSRMDDLLFPVLTPEHFTGSGFIAPSVLAPVRFRITRFFSGMGKRFIGRCRKCLHV